MPQLPVHRLSKKFSQNREDAIQNGIHYWKWVKHMMELHELKDKSIHFRQKMQHDQIKTNYQNEFDKIRGGFAALGIECAFKAHPRTKGKRTRKIGG